MSAAMPEATAAAELERRRLLWRCRRGMKELDVLLERYVHRHEARERGALGRLLELSDPQLAAYLLGGSVPADPALAALVSRIACGAAATRASA